MHFLCIIEPTSEKDTYPSPVRIAGHVGSCFPKESFVCLCIFCGAPNARHGEKEQCFVFLGSLICNVRPLRRLLQRNIEITGSDIDDNAESDE